MIEGQLILIAGALLAAALAASLLAGRIRIPGLVVFLGLGMAIGSDGAGWIDFDDYDLARTVGVVALILILFEGGLTAGFAEIRPVIGSALSLAFIATIVTAVIAGLAATWLFGLSRLEGLLPGSACCVGRRFAASLRARWKARPASTTRWPCCSSSGSFLGSSSRTTALPTWRCYSSASWGLAWRPGWGSDGCPSRLCAGRGLHPRACIPSARWR